MNAPSATEIKATVLRIASMPSGSDIAGFTATFGFDAVAAVLTADDCDKAAANRHEGLQFELNTLFDQDPTS